MEPEIRKAFELAKQVQAIAQRGLTFSTDDYNIERYSELESISHALLGIFTNTPQELIRNFYLNKREYPTPKTDIRGVVFNEKNELLMVRERDDNRWSIPGGWADIGYSPREIVVKEVAEETGFIAEAKKLLAVLDKKCHPHTPQLEYAYKIFIQCTITGGIIKEAHDIIEVAFFRSRIFLPCLKSE